MYSTAQEKDPTTDFGFKRVPENDKQTLVGQVFSNVASKYDIMNDFMSGGMHRLWKERFVNYIKVFPNINHLDVAGGTGDIAFKIIKKYQNEVLQDDKQIESIQSQPDKKGNIIIYDLNQEMLDEGQKRLNKLGYQDVEGLKIQFQHGNAEKLPFKDNQIDSYSIAFGIRNVTNKQTALKEAFRVLKPGGQFLCLELNKIDTPIIKQLYDFYSFQVIPNIGQIVANDRDSYQYLVESIRMFPNKEKFARMIADAGFSHVVYEQLTFGVVSIHRGFKVS